MMTISLDIKELERRYKYEKECLITAIEDIFSRRTVESCSNYVGINNEDSFGYFYAPGGDVVGYFVHPISMHQELDGRIWVSVVYADGGGDIELDDRLVDIDLMTLIKIFKNLEI